MLLSLIHHSTIHCFSFASFQLFLPPSFRLVLRLSLAYPFHVSIIVLVSPPFSFLLFCIPSILLYLLPFLPSLLPEFRAILHFIPSLSFIYIPVYRLSVYTSLPPRSLLRFPSPPPLHLYFLTPPVSLISYLSLLHFSLSLLDLHPCSFI